MTTAAHEQAEPGNAGADDRTPPDVLPMNCPPFPSWGAVPADDAAGRPEPRTLYAAMLLAGALGGAGLSGLKALCRAGEAGRVLIGSAGRDAVTAALALSDELLKQAWEAAGLDPAAPAGG